MYLAVIDGHDDIADLHSAFTLCRATTDLQL